MKSKKLLTLLGAAGVVVQTTAFTAAPTYASSTPAQLERMLQKDPMVLNASAVFDILATRLADAGATGPSQNPDTGAPSQNPDTGAPSQNPDRGGGHYDG